MPRPREAIPIEEKIEQLDAEISAAEENQKTLKAKRKELVETKQKKDYAEIEKLIKSSGKSMDELKAFLQS